jgi:ribosomal protein S18 acetylase RimI-like enzyme
MKNVSIVRYSPHTSDIMLTAQLVECYRDVFADSPWNEWLKCPKCQKYFGRNDSGFLASQKFQHCNVPLIDYWSRDQVVSDLYYEITEQTSCWLAMDEQKVIGFCWGYSIPLADLEIKLDISFGDNLKKDTLVAYQDEAGVLSSYRGHKIAKAMVAHRLDDFIAQGLDIGIVRTRQYPEPSITFLWYTEKLGYKILARYPGDDGRVILGRELNGLKKLLSF